MIMEWFGFDGLPCWNCRTEPFETMDDYDRIMAEREIAIEYWLKGLK